MCMNDENGWNAAANKMTEELEKRRIKLYGKLTSGEIINKCDHAQRATSRV